ncbi:MAG: hypothetical protein ACI9KN_000292 [Gammaproteobacteria bacterium]|jgi:hypothetical protein
MPIEKLLAQLRGIHPPVEPGIWPLAPGWWFLLGLVSVTILLLVYRYHRQKSQRLYRLANRELQRIASRYFETNDSQTLLLNLSKWLRQVSIAAFPDNNIAAVSGPRWIDFLDQTMPNHEFTLGAEKVFGGEIYRALPKVEADTILNLCLTWLDSIKPHLETNALKPENTASPC